jgi:hypothetical protein
MSRRSRPVEILFQEPRFGENATKGFAFDKFLVQSKTSRENFIHIQLVYQMRLQVFLKPLYETLNLLRPTSIKRHGLNIFKPKTS